MACLERKQERAWGGDLLQPSGQIPSHYHQWILKLTTCFSGNLRKKRRFKIDRFDNKIVVLPLSEWNHLDRWYANAERSSTKMANGDWDHWVCAAERAPQLKHLRPFQDRAALAPRTEWEAMQSAEQFHQPRIPVCVDSAVWRENFCCSCAMR